MDPSNTLCVVGANDQKRANELKKNIFFAMKEPLGGIGICEFSSGTNVFFVFLVFEGFADTPQWGKTLALGTSKALRH